MEKKTFVVIGGKWFDNVNGNTYNSAKIIDTDTGHAYYTPFCYGFGFAYLQDAKEFIKNELKISDSKLIDAGSFYMKKNDCKNGNF